MIASPDFNSKEIEERHNANTQSESIEFDSVLDERLGNEASEL